MFCICLDTLHVYHKATLNVYQNRCNILFVCARQISHTHSGNSRVAVELPGLARVIVDLALLSLGLEHVLTGRNPFDAVLHFLDMFDGGSERGWMFFPCLLRHVQQTPEPPLKE